MPRGLPNKARKWKTAISLVHHERDLILESLLSERPLRVVKLVFLMIFCDRAERFELLLRIHSVRQAVLLNKIFRQKKGTLR